MVDDQVEPNSSPDMLSTASLLLQEKVFPSAFPSWHAQILVSLQQCSLTIASFEPTIRVLLQPEVDWIAALSLSPGEPPSVMTAQQMRDVLHKKKILTPYFLVDTILAELVIGRVLNHELFAQLKGLTVVACLAAMLLKGDKAAESDTTIDNALRTVRLMANTGSRDSVATLFSLVNFVQPIESLLEAIAEQRKQFKNVKNVNNNTVAIETVLRNLCRDRPKQNKGRNRESGARLKNRVALSETDMDEHTELVLLRDISRRRGRTRKQPWEVEEDQSLTAQAQTLLVSTQRNGLMDLQARRWQSQSVAAVMSMRNLLLPCNAWLAMDEQVQRLVQVLRDQLHHKENLAAGWNLLQLVMGMSDDELMGLPIWPTDKLVRPKRGQRRTDPDGKDRNGAGLWLTPTQVWFQRDVEVSQSRVHGKLRKLVPNVDLLLMLPLPDWVLTLLDGFGRGAMSRSQLLKSLADANMTAGTALTLRQLKNYFRIWLVRQGTDSAVAGILCGKTSQQCSPIAYSHLKTASILSVWSAYLSVLGEPPMSGVSPGVDAAVGSALYPHHEELKALLGQYQSVVRPYCQQRSLEPTTLSRLHNLRVRHCLLILHLSTAARPVTEMYGRRSDYCLLSRFIRLEDKEARSVSSARLVPLGVRAVAQLQAWESYLRDLATLAVPALALLAEAAKKALDSRGPLFFWAEPALEGSSMVTTEHVAPNNMMKQFDPLLPLVANWHRHAVRSHLVQQRVPTYLIDALMGHEEMGGEFCHQYSSAALSELFALSDILDQWHESLQLEAMTGWTIR